ncbi:hypothetical protein PBY51_003138 [Eleginops maclovinus]|uniref:Uncharacterized protein n=1 Tax=Eleginops maclovinus TaxID=56733 RepID=A0AAN8AL70_ELEMC|nr:hypothetical protein PBY51_003138 [Eleginops maclovinus]
MKELHKARAGTWGGEREQEDRHRSCTARQPSVPRKNISLFNSLSPKALYAPSLQLETERCDSTLYLMR